MDNKKRLYRLDFESIYPAAKKHLYLRKDYINDLKECQGITLTSQNLYNITKQLPPIVTAISIISENLNITIDECIDEVSKDLYTVNFDRLLNIKNRKGKIKKSPLSLSEWLEELQKEDGFYLSEPYVKNGHILNLGCKLPNIFCVLSAMAKKAGVKIEDIIIKI